MQPPQNCAVTSPQMPPLQSPSVRQLPGTQTPALQMYPLAPPSPYAPLQTESDDGSLHAPHAPLAQRPLPPSSEHAVPSTLQSPASTSASEPLSTSEAVFASEAPDSPSPPASEAVAESSPPASPDCESTPCPLVSALLLESFASPAVESGGATLPSKGETEAPSAVASPPPSSSEADRVVDGPPPQLVAAASAAPARTRGVIDLRKERSTCIGASQQFHGYRHA
jgi:hypothetical protein